MFGLGTGGLAPRVQMSVFLSCRVHGFKHVALEG